MSKKLTIKQEKFILKYFECGNATEAYKYAYSTKRMKEKTINEESSKLLSSHKITTRLEELRAIIQANSVWTVDKLIEAHTRTYEIGIGDVSSSHMVTEGAGDGISNTLEVDMRDTNLAGASKALVEIGKLIGAYEKDNKQKAGELDLFAILKSVAK